MGRQAWGASVYGRCRRGRRICAGADPACLSMYMGTVRCSTMQILLLAVQLGTPVANRALSMLQVTFSIVAMKLTD
jgi:hypothetical protein